MCLFSGAFIICFLPYFTLFMVVAYCGNDQCVNPTVFTITIWFGYFNSTLNPILYPLCNANFKTAFKRMLRMDSVKENKNELNKNGVQGEFSGILQIQVKQLILKYVHTIFHFILDSKG